VKLAESAPDYRTRLHALWTLDGIDSLEPAMVTKALSDASRDVRASAIRLSEKWLAKDQLTDDVLKRLDDPDWSVREQLAASLGVMPSAKREPAIASLLERYANDPIVVDAALSGLRGDEAAVLDRMFASATQTPQRETAITMLAATIVRGGQDAAIQNLFKGLAMDSRPEWQRSAVLRGAEVAVLGAPMPGATATRRGGPPTGVQLPCPTCPGGRAGPGGAYAFERPAAAPGGGRGGGTRIVRLNTEPTALSTWLATRTDDLGARTARVLARVEWPGKPGASAPIAPLTAEEQQRFEAGRDVYKNICQACHQPDGRGQDRVAPSLVGSTLALASPDIPARILLNGKEGPIGLMPPVGSVLSDGQIAGVLTYVRREWGQPGSAVDPATVKSVRELTAGRTRPWTNDELLALAGGRGQRP
jgi:mono/diheme cytochrome c family protein